MKKITIKDILIPGVKLKTKKLNSNDLVVKELIQQTIKEQTRILDLLNIDYSKLRLEYITI